MSSEPTVSVVIPTYDRPEMLRRAVESVVAQTYDRIELVVVDGPSTHPASDVVDDVDGEFDRVQCVRNDEKEGVTAARNTGLALATGTYIAFLDDDDRWHEEKLAAQIARFERPDDNLGMVYSGVRQMGPDGTVNAVKRHDHGGDIFERLMGGNFIGTMSAVMVRRDVIDTVGDFDENLPVWEDWDLYLRVAREYKIASVAEPHVDRYSGEHEQTSDDYELRREAAPELLEKHRPEAAERGRSTERRFVAGVELELTRSAVSNGVTGKARRHAFNSLRSYPTFGGLLYFCLSAGGKYTFIPAKKLKRMFVRTASNT
ncbi:glycosyltransferase family 2 protein [Natronomonas halophila]|uniref:glycosyltransferase family 2 protein n=1 Tax=Natronomonas halophila TaxID=2747817 RepID=UPI0015B612B3|nr:glycosyltransferase family A protein [Natronomonas halophila]QLD87073.1 glycosyltransferase family 2 protein [Natronomonas halophila]